jgi:hypothetical protein
MSRRMRRGWTRGQWPLHGIKCNLRRCREIDWQMKRASVVSQFQKVLKQTIRKNLDNENETLINFGRRRYQRAASTNIFARMMEIIAWFIKSKWNSRKQRNFDEKLFILFALWNSFRCKNAGERAEKYGKVFCWRWRFWKTMFPNDQQIELHTGLEVTNISRQLLNLGLELDFKVNLSVTDGRFDVVKGICSKFHRKMLSIFGSSDSILIRF